MAKRKATSKGSVEVGPVLELIVAMTDQFCREKLNEEYAVLCRRLAEKLARKRPSPLTQRQAGVLGLWDRAGRRLGQLSWRPPPKPHNEDDGHRRGVRGRESTGSGKAKTIRTCSRFSSSTIIGRCPAGWTRTRWPG